ncbi:MAG: S8 family serine peptidase [Ignavibacteriaceae bacterium]|nr:S8 family serine peptidase [Ignavibacteriaceae bacterium]
MNTARYLLLILVFTLSLVTETMPQRAGDAIPGELIIQLKNKENRFQLVSDFRNIGLHEKELLSDIMNVYLFAYDISKGEAQDVLYAVKLHPQVSLAQFNHVFGIREGKQEYEKNPSNTVSSAMPDDPQFGNQWALNNTGQNGGTPDADIDAPEAWDYTTGGITALGDSVVVAVIDGGFDLNHQDLRFFKNYLDIPGNNIDDDGNGYVDDTNGWNAYNNSGNITSDNHGTHVAGIAAARGNNGVGVSGVNWGAKVMAIQGSSSSEATVVKAYGYALKMRAMYNQTNGVKGAFVVVTNSSFGVDYGQPSNYPVWCALYDSLGSYGVLSCGATANLNINIDLQGDIPTACPSNYLISVTNTTSSDQKNGGAAYGLTTIDLGAPGTSIFNTLPNNSYGNLTGTSMATPTVAGAVALLISGSNPGLLQQYRENPGQAALIFKDYILQGVDQVPALNGLTVTGGRLNIFKALQLVAVPPDTIPPTVITDLSAGNPTSSAITLTWTAPSDTSRNGVVSYRIRYSASPILTVSDFNNATPVQFAGSPKPAGQSESVKISGLQPGTSYYFAIRSLDTWSNISPVSNSPAGTTLVQPVYSANMQQLYHTMLVNQIITDSVMISNISQSPSTLDYTVSLINNTFPEGSLTIFPVLKPDSNQPLNLNRSKENPFEINSGHFDGQGGPDQFGYKWIDSDETGGPAYIWQDISSTGTPAANWTPTGTYNAKDEGFAGPFDIGFSFKFYGQPKTQVRISSNGFLTFGTLTTNTFTNSSIPSAGAPNDMIAPFWDDLDGSNQGTVHYQSFADKFVVQYTNWPRYSATGGLTFQIVLQRSGKILFYYNNLNSGTLNSATIGIENADGTIALQPAYNSPFAANSKAVMFQAEPDWLAANNISGTLYNNNSAAVNLSFNSNGLPLGNYSMDMVVTTNDPAAPADTIPVRMTVTNEIPVELASFSAVQEGGSVILNWMTATETNNAGFEVQRKSSDESWKPLGFVNGKGTTTTPSAYTFSDNNVITGKISYRLKQTDFDGSVNYSPVTELDVVSPAEYSLSQNYPNPFNPVTNIRYSIPEEQTVVLEVFNHLGEKVAEPVNGRQKAGYHSVQFDASKLASGVYIYSISAGSFKHSRKLILMK